MFYRMKMISKSIINVHRRVLVWALCLLLGSLCTLSAEIFDRDPPLISLGAGVGEVFDSHPKAGFMIEYRPAFRWHHVGSWVCLGQGADQAIYAGAGILMNLHCGSRWILTPSFGGGYFKPSDILDLGSELEFRSGLEFSFRFKNEQRLGLSLSHLSNGGISEKNPGTEILLLMYSIPLGKQPAP